MNTPVKVAAFLAALVAAFLAAWGVGNAVDPIATEPVTHEETHSEDTHSDEEGAHTAEHLPAGLSVSENGYTLAIDDPVLRPGRQQVSFRIVGPDGVPVTDYDVEHEKQLHLIAVRRDFTGFQHVHPELAEGTWSTSLDLTPGEWRVFADFKASGAEALTLGSDLRVTGRPGSSPQTPDTRVAEVGGYTVTLDGDLTGGENSLLMLVVEKDGEYLKTEPYLGAAGHLVALREGDLAYLHVHPESDENLVFEAAVPSTGRYHLYLDFKIDGVVRTAQFALSAGDGHGHEH